MSNDFAATKLTNGRKPIVKNDIEIEEIIKILQGIFYLYVYCEKKGLEKKLGRPLIEIFSLQAMTLLQIV